MCLAVETHRCSYLNHLNMYMPACLDINLSFNLHEFLSREAIRVFMSLYTEAILEDKTDRQSFKHFSFQTFI